MMNANRVARLKKPVMKKVGGLYGDFNVGDAVGRNRDGDCRRKIRHLTEGLFATTLTNKTWSVLTSS